MAFSEQNFSSALATWKNINLSELQKTLDSQGIEVVENQKESVVGRKALADKTKDFKKIPDEEKVSVFKGLLKSYQTEIDNLTKRSKSVESAFLSLYKILAEAPDPYPLLEAAVDQTVKIAEARDLEDELQRVKADNAELQRRVSEFASMEAAKKKAESKVEQLEEKMDAAIQERVAQKENELNATYDERMHNYEAREQDLQRQVSLLKDQLRDLRVSNESTEARLLDQSQRLDQEVVAKLAEMDMVVAELERANTRAATELLRAEIESLKTGNDRSDHVKDLEYQVASLESEVDRLSQSLDAQKAHARVASSTAREIEQLKHSLRGYADYDEIKRELEIMKYVEFAGLEGDLDEGDGMVSDNQLGLQLPNPNASKASAHPANSLETLLATKNKRILEELTKFRILRNELEASLQQAQDDLASTTQELEKHRQLNERLESDLLKIEQHGQGLGGKENGSAPLADTTEDDVLAGLGLELGLTTKNTSNIDPSVQTPRPIPFTSSADTSILPIVTSQRDRFRQRNAELEEELRKQFQVISELRSEIRSLQSDNLKLYEKVRYMQSYRENAHSTLDPLPASSTIAPSAGELNKYSARYEEAMNPFEAFRGREAARAYSNLNPLERGVLMLTRAVLGNRRARNTFIVYAIGLHVLVMLTLYECAMSSSPQVTQPIHIQSVPHPI
ncbi:CASP C terminal-domain-containing protein [Multifurca ochricompacta]|uniref:Protein CASP n=1 Tax=Multifurca ochricompacta TaxID=376703 RepID=A0AAD4QQS1_9AGAM|nr:CASP C terminal-domain-containing protein [Multifurca ochricompacta]